MRGQQIGRASRANPAAVPCPEVVGQNGRSSALTTPSAPAAATPTVSGARLDRRRGSVCLAVLIRPDGRSAAALEDHLAGAERDRLALGARLAGPLAPVELGVDEHARALAQVLRAASRRGAVDLDGEVVGLVDPLLAGLSAGCGGDPEPGDVGARRQRPELDVPGQVSRQCCGSDVPHRILLGSWLSCRYYAAARPSRGRRPEVAEVDGDDLAVAIGCRAGRLGGGRLAGRLGRLVCDLLLADATLGLAVGEDLAEVAADRARQQRGAPASSTGNAAATTTMARTPRRRVTTAAANQPSCTLLTSQRPACS